METLVVAGAGGGDTQRPTFDLNGQRVLGSQPYETFAAIITGLQL